VLVAPVSLGALLVIVPGTMFLCNSADSALVALLLQLRMYDNVHSLVVVGCMWQQGFVCTYSTPQMGCSECIVSDMPRRAVLRGSCHVMEVWTAEQCSLLASTGQLYGPGLFVHHTMPLLAASMVSGYMRFIATCVHMLHAACL
jgi:hypothetical protein